MMSTIALALGQDAFRNSWAPFFSSGFLFFSLALLVIAIIGGWKVFEKAGQPGWAILIPFFNLYILLKIAGRPGWWAADARSSPLFRGFSIRSYLSIQLQVR